MHTSKDVGKCVPVRYEPFDVGRVYAFVATLRYLLERVPYVPVFA